MTGVKSDANTVQQLTLLLKDCYLCSSEINKSGRSMSTMTSNLVAKPSRWRLKWWNTWGAKRGDILPPYARISQLGEKGTAPIRYLGLLTCEEMHFRKLFLERSSPLKTSWKLLVSMTVIQMKAWQVIFSPLIHMQSFELFTELQEPTKEEKMATKATLLSITKFESKW